MQCLRCHSPRKAMHGSGDIHKVHLFTLSGFFRVFLINFITVSPFPKSISIYYIGDIALI